MAAVTIIMAVSLASYAGGVIAVIAAIIRHRGRGEI